VNSSPIPWSSGSPPAPPLMSPQASSANFFGVTGSKRHAFLPCVGGPAGALPHNEPLCGRRRRRDADRRDPVPALFSASTGHALRHGHRQRAGLAPERKGTRHSAHRFTARASASLSSPDLSTASVRPTGPGSALPWRCSASPKRCPSPGRSPRALTSASDSNQEFIGQGLSNIIGSFFSSYAASGSFTRTG